MIFVASVGQNFQALAAFLCRIDLSIKLSMIFGKQIVYTNICCITWNQSM